MTDPTNCSLMVLVGWSLRTNLRCGNGGLDQGSFMDCGEPSEGGFMSKQEEGNWGLRSGHSLRTFVERGSREVSRQPEGNVGQGWIFKTG